MPNEAPSDRALLERVLPRAQRDAARRRLFDYRLEELNGLGDRLRYLATEADAPRAPGRPTIEAERALVHRRIEELVEIFGWIADEAIPLLWERTQQPFDDLEDAFAPALLLRRLSTGARVERWLASLPSSEQELIREIPGGD